MFVYSLPDTVWWPVTVKVPADGGRTVAQEFEACVRLLDRDELLDLDTDPAGKLPGVVLGWRGVQTADGEPVPYSAEALEAMLRVPCLMRALRELPFNAAVGHREKN